MRLKDLREDHDLKQVDVAKVLNISQQYYQCYESGKNEIPLRHCITLAKYYNVSVDYIVGLTSVPYALNGQNPMLKKQIDFFSKLEKADPKIQKAIAILLEK